LIFARSSGEREENERGALSVVSLMREGIEAMDEFLRSDEKKSEEHFPGGGIQFLFFSS
jgi:hypothetical protein